MAAHTSINLADLLPATFTAPELTDEQFLALCEQFPDATLEYTEDGEVIVMPPTDPLNSARVARVVYRLLNWAEKTGRGVVCGPDGGFRLPTRARRSPDAAWFEGYPSSDQRFPIFAPQFVIEVRSPDDRLARLRDKMQRYINAGVLLAWLIDPFERTVAIYRPNREPETLDNPASVSGEGPVEGFVLNLDGIFSASGA
jgi:Uma2 family endonuclease